MATYPSQDISSKTPRLKASEQNALHDFASYNCLFTLSGINETDLQSQQKLFDPHLKDVIARSAGIGINTFSGTAFPDQETFGAPDDTIGRQTINPKASKSYNGSRSILSRNHDIFFENVNITSVVGPNVERNLANFTKMEFELHEPYSITFIEKIRACAYNNGYLDYQAAPFLLTIEWKGFDEHGKHLTEKSKGLVRKIPIFITRVDFDVNEGGARYNVVAVPYSEMAFDDSYKFPRKVIAVNVNSVKQWTIDVKKGLQEQMEDEIKELVRTFPDEYEFDISLIEKFLGNGETVTRENDSVANTATVAETVVYSDVLTPISDPQIKAKTKGMNIDSNTNVVKAFEDMIRSTGYYQQILENFWGTYAKGETESSLVEKLINPDEMAKLLAKNQYIDWFMIKPKIENLPEQGLDPVTKMYPKRITYQAIPYKVHALKIILPGVSFGDIDWEKYARRKYNYIYTGDNIDVQNLRINYKTAYYYRNVRKDAKAFAEDKKFSSFVEGLKKIFGRETAPEPSLPLRQYPSVLKQKNLVQEVNPRSAKANEFFDYLVNPVADMINVELEILGDPAYVAQDLYAPLKDAVIKPGEFDQSLNSFNMEQYMPVINLRYRIPADIDEAQGKMFSDKYLDDNLFFSGAYQVTKIESSMNQGQFTQMLTLVRLNNQGGSGAEPALINAANDGAKEILTAENIKRSALKKFGEFFRN